MTPEAILIALLEKLRVRQSCCPYCQSEFICDEQCVLKGLWFRR
jgi:hypothetical protein